MRVPMHTPRRWKGAAAAALLSAFTVALLVCLAVIPATRVQAATYTVDAATDEADANLGDGVCATAGGQCTLRAAIEQANANAADTNVIAIGVAGPIVLAGGLPIITDDNLVITGSGQQVSLAVAQNLFHINAHGVQISNLVLDGDGTGARGVRIDALINDVTLNSVTVREFANEGVLCMIPGPHERITVLNSTITANAMNGIVLRGEDSEIRDSFITNNGGDGLVVRAAHNALVQGNTLSGNANAQISVETIAAGHRVAIVRNDIVSASDGIVIQASVAATANIEIGLSVANRNVFRGAIVPPDQHLVNHSPATVNAIFNDWHNYNPGGIEAVICHNGEGGCPGLVLFDPFIDSPMPLESPTPTPTPTQTPGGETATPTATPEGGPPGDVETLALITGCNPLAWTGADGTPIATIDAAVAPADILVALWASVGGVWLGYSPQFPDVSDLTEMNRLDVVFVCVSAPGTFSRPVI